MCKIRVLAATLVVAASLCSPSGSAAGPGSGFLPLWSGTFATPASGGRVAPVTASAWKTLRGAYRSLDLPPPSHDRRLSEVAALLAELIVEDEALSDRAAGRLSFELWRRGVPTPAVVPIALRFTGPSDVRGVASRLAGSPAALRGTHAGVASVPLDDGQVFVALVAERRASLVHPFPLRAARGTSEVLSLRLARELRRGRLVLSAPDGELLERPLEPAGKRWIVAVPFLLGAGEYRVEVMADGPGGPEVVLLFPVYVGVEPPKLPTERLPAVPEAGVTSPVPRRVLEAAAVALVSAERRRGGVLPLRTTPALSAVARSHSEESRATGAIAHVSRVSGGPSDRLAARGLRATRVTENVGAGATIKAVHEAFVGSPAHRANILDPTVTEVGVGVAVDRSGALPRVYVTYLFSAGLISSALGDGDAGAEALAALVWRQLHSVRAAAELPRLVADRAAARAARDHASAMLARRSAATRLGGISLLDLLFLHGAATPRTPVALRVFAGDALAVGDWSELTRSRYTRAGVGLARGRSDRAAVYVAIALLGP